MRLVTLTIAAVVLAGVLGSEALADHGSHGSARHYGASIRTHHGHHGYHSYRGHHGYHGYHGYHGQHGYSGRHGAYYRSPYGHLPYGYPVIVRPHAYGYRTIPHSGIHGVYNPYPLNRFYYQGRNFGLGVRF